MLDHGIGFIFLFLFFSRSLQIFKHLDLEKFIFVKSESK